MFPPVIKTLLGPPNHLTLVALTLHTSLVPALRMSLALALHTSLVPVLPTSDESLSLPLLRSKMVQPTDRFSTTSLRTLNLFFSFVHSPILRLYLLCIYLPHLHTAFDLDISRL